MTAGPVALFNSFRYSTSRYYDHNVVQIYNWRILKGIFKLCNDIQIIKHIPVDIQLTKKKIQSIYKTAAQYFSTVFQEF